MMNTDERGIPEQDNTNKGDQLKAARSMLREAEKEPAAAPAPESRPGSTADVTTDTLLKFAENLPGNRVDQDALQELRDEVAGTPAAAAEEAATGLPQVPLADAPAEAGEGVTEAQGATDYGPDAPVELEDLQQFEAAAGQEYNLLRGAAAELQQRYANLQQLRVLDPVAAASEEATLIQQAAVFEERSTNFQRQRGGMHARVLATADRVVAKTAFGQDTPLTNDQVRQIGEYASKKLGLPPQEIGKLATNVGLVRMIAEHYAAEHGAPQSPRRRSRAPRPRAGSLEASLRKMEKSRGVRK